MGEIDDIFNKLLLKKREKQAKTETLKHHLWWNDRLFKSRKLKPHQVIKKPNCLTSLTGIQFSAVQFSHSVVSDSLYAKTIFQILCIFQTFSFTCTYSEYCVFIKRSSLKLLPKDKYFTK